MISNGKALNNFIDLILNQQGYLKKKDTWYKHTDECICFFSIGKSPFGGYYDHTFGFFLKDLNKPGNEFPIYYKCDLKINLDFFIGNEFTRRILDLDNPEFKASEREDIITEMFELYIMPFLEDVSSKEGIKSAVTKYADLIYHLKSDAMSHLNLEPPDE